MALLSNLVGEASLGHAGKLLDVLTSTNHTTLSSAPNARPSLTSLATTRSACLDTSFFSGVCHHVVRLGGEAHHHLLLLALAQRGQDVRGSRRGRWCPARRRRRPSSAYARPPRADACPPPPPRRWRYRRLRKRPRPPRHVARRLHVHHMHALRGGQDTGPERSATSAPRRAARGRERSRSCRRSGSRCSEPGRWAQPWGPR